MPADGCRAAWRGLPLCETQWLVRTIPAADNTTSIAQAVSNHQSTFSLMVSNPKLRASNFPRSAK